MDTFFFPVHAMVGERLHRVMRVGVNDYDRVILICSQESLGRSGVLNEIEEALTREAREGGRQVLMPIRLDDYVFDGWAPDRVDVKQAVCDRVIADFTKARSSDKAFRSALRTLLKGLERNL